MYNLNQPYYGIFIGITVSGIILTIIHTIKTIMDKKDKTRWREAIFSDMAVILSFIAGTVVLFVFKPETPLFAPSIRATAKDVSAISQDKLNPDEITGNIFILTSNLSGVTRMTYRFDDEQEIMFDFDNGEIEVPVKFRDGQAHSLTVTALPELDGSTKIDKPFKSTFYFWMQWDWIAFSTNGTDMRTDITYIITSTQKFDFQISLEGYFKDRKIKQFVYGFDNDSLTYLNEGDSEFEYTFGGSIDVPPQYTDGSVHKLDVRAQLDDDTLTPWRSYWFRVQDY